MKALVVDDSRAMRMILKNILQKIGFTVEEAGHGKEALERLNAGGPVRLALLDWNMPEMNGFELLKEIRKKPEWKDMAVVMVTTESEVGQMQAALDAGANEYLMKPFDREALAEKLSLIGATSA